MNIPELIKEAHDNAVERGFYDCPKCAGGKITCAGAGQCDHDGTECNMDDNCGEFEFHTCNTCKGSCIDPNKNIGELLMLIVSELGEALEAHRCGRFADWGKYESSYWIGKESSIFENDIKNTFEDKIADVFIGLFSLCGYLGIELRNHVNVMDFTGWNIGESLLYITEHVTKIRTGKTNSYFYDDILYCLLGFCQISNIPIEKFIRAKMAYNRTRPHKHNKEY